MGSPTIKYKVSRRQAVEWLVERCNTLELDPIHLEDVVQDFLWEQGEPMRTIAG